MLPLCCPLYDPEVLAVSDWINPLDWTDQDWNAVSAIATVAAVLTALGIALIGGTLRRRREKARRPALTLAYRAHYDTAVETASVKRPTGGDPAEEYVTKGFYVRLAVTNAPNHDPARNVEVLVVEVQALEGARGFETLFPWWADEETRLSFPPLGWTHSTSNVMVLPPGITRTVDLGVFFHKIDTRLMLGLHPPPLADRHWLYPGKYRIVLAISCHNADDAVYYDLVLEFDGQWGAEPGEIWEHVKITSPPRRIPPPPPGPDTIPETNEGVVKS